MKIEEITLIASASSQMQQLFFRSVLFGLKGKNVKAKIRPSSLPIGTKAVAVWGWRQGEGLRRQGHDVLVFERAYLGDRFEWTSVAWNGLNGRGDFCLPDKVDGKRFKKHFAPLKPWRENGDYILIMAQVRGDMSLMGKDLTAFYEDAARQLEAIHKKPVFYRAHPDAKGRDFNPRIKGMFGTLADALEGAALVVTYNSNSGVDAVVNGIPAMSFDEGSMAWNVTSHSFADSIKKPDREAWANKLAYCQFTPDEILSGEYWGRYAGRAA